MVRCEGIWLHVCLILFLFFPSLTVSNSLNLCSREGSIEVQRLIEKFVVPVIEYYEYELPETCPLKIENSRFYLEVFCHHCAIIVKNQYKERLENGYYHCGLCGKTFVHEYYLLLHNERKHPDLQNPSTVCLDKYRDMFDGVSGNKNLDCRSSDIQRSLIQCQKTILRCFPTDESDFESDLYKYMYRTLCAPMRCKTNDQENVEEYKPITMTAVVLPIVIIIVIFVIIIIFMYKKFSSPKDDLSIFSKLD